MFSRLSRLPLRRSFHSGRSFGSASKFSHKIAFALGVSAATATYLTWSLNSNQIALDTSPTSRKLKENTPVKSHDVLSSMSGDSDALSNGHESVPSSEEKDDVEDPPDDQAAYNPVTGEINWDCPCLGGMAHGPCGPEFREAFSCFVFSEAEPKGINCVEKFQNMQNCFRAHPEVYADEIMDDEVNQSSAVDNSDFPEQPKDGKLNGAKASAGLDAPAQPRIHTVKESS